MLELKHISKKFHDRAVLDDLSITFPDNGFIGIQGASGCGKSTLLYIIGMLDRNFQGDIYWDNEPIKQSSSFIQKHISFMMQNKDYVSALTIKENILLACQVGHVHYTNSQLKKICIQLGIQDLLEKYPKQLSGGQLKRVSLAKALLKKSSIILCDEPTGALHFKQAHEVMSLLKKYSHDSLIIIVSHDPHLLKTYCDSVLTLEEGKLKGNIHQNQIEKQTKKTKLYSLFVYPIRQLLYQKNKLIFLCIFQWIMIVAFFVMMTGMNGILEAIHFSEIHSVNSHFMTIENKDNSLFENIMTDTNIEACTNLYHLEQIQVKSSNQTFSPNLSFLPIQTSHIQLSQGRLPKDTYEIIITDSLYQKLSQKQSLEFIFQDKYLCMNIVGIIKPTLFQSDEIYVMPSLQNEFVELKDDYFLLIEAKNNQGRKLYKQLSQDYIVYSEVFERIDSYQSLLQLARLIAYVFVGVSFMISLILMRIVLSILYFERRHDVAYLLSLGITHKRFVILSLLESLFLGGVIAGGGCLLSMILYEYLNHVVVIKKLYSFSLKLNVIWHSYIDLYILIIVMYMLMSILGSLKPLRSVLKTNVVEVLREE